MICEGFATGEVYTTNISTEKTYGKSYGAVENIVIVLSKEDIDNVTNPHGDALVITIEINDFYVKFLVDYGSSICVLFINALLAMGKTKNDFKKMDFHLVGFCRKCHLSSESDTSSSGLGRRIESDED